MCGGIFNNSFIVNFLENLTLKNFEIVKFDEITAMILVSSFLWDMV